MFELAGDLGFHEKPRTAVGIMGVVLLNLLECDFAIQFGIPRDKHFTQAALGMWSERKIPRPGLPMSGRKEIVAGNFSVRCRLAQIQARQAVLQIGVFDLLEYIHRRCYGGNRLETLFRIAAMLFHVPGDQGQKQIPIGGRQKPFLDENVFQKAGLLQNPGLHALDQLVAGEKIHLEGEHAE